MVSLSFTRRHNSYTSQPFRIDHTSFYLYHLLLLYARDFIEEQHDLYRTVYTVSQQSFVCWYQQTLKKPGQADSKSKSKNTKVIDTVEIRKV